MSRPTAQEALDRARSFVGYREKASNYNLDSFTANAGSANYTRFGRDCYLNPAEWCAMFVSDCSTYGASAAEKKEICWGRWPHYNCGTLADDAKAAGCFHWSKAKGGNYTPQPADWIIFTYDGKTRNHVGMVDHVSGGYVYTIEGNKGNAVKYQSYPIGDSTIYGYSTPRYAEAVPDTPIKQYQRWLTGISVDGVYGPETKKAAIYWHEKAMDFRDKYALGVWDWNVYGWGHNYPCQYGDDEGWDIYIVQGQLYCLGFDPQGFDGKFGAGTANAVGQLQEKVGLPVTKRVDGDTWAALFGEKKPAHTVLKLGSFGGEVFYLQRKLFGLGFVLPCDGVFGDSTQDDLIDFQTQQGLTADGEVRSRTWEKIDS